MIEPIGHLAQPAHAVMALADPAQAVAFAFKQAHPRFHPMMDDRCLLYTSDRPFIYNRMRNARDRFLLLHNHRRKQRAGRDDHDLMQRFGS